MGILANGVWTEEAASPKSDVAAGAFVRPDSLVRNWITPDGAAGPTGEGGYKAEASRCHLYVAINCPWAHRTWIFRKLKRLEAAIPMSIACPRRTSAEDIPLDDRSVDTVLSTWTLCTIPAIAKALVEMRRVLRPDGQLVFVEHGRSPEPRIVAWQNRLNPIQRRLAGGCNLNRKIDALIVAAGFRLTRIETDYVAGPKPWTYTYKGVAEPG